MIVLFIILCVAAGVLTCWAMRRDVFFDEWFLPLFTGCVVTLLAGVVLAIPEMVWHEKGAYAEGTVIERVYTPSSTGVGTGTVVGSNGQVGTGTVTTYTSESYKVIAEVDGEVMSLDVAPVLWQWATPGRKICGHWYVGLPWRLTRGFSAESVKFP